MKLTAVLTALLISAAPGLAGAAEVDSTKRIEKRQEAQDNRIERGRKSGDLTKREAEKLEKGQARVDKAERKAMRDGEMTKKERARIEKLQDNQSKAINEQREDKQKRQ